MSAEYTFRPAKRENVGLFLGLAGGTGSGKTLSALRIASGIVGPKERFAVIDTENRRARHYADEFNFDVLDLEAPFNPKRYEDSVKAALQAGYKAIVLDSASHEHDGEGGYLDMQAEDLQQRVERYMKKYPDSKEYDVIDKMTPSSWIAPKKERKRMMQVLLAASTSIPIIFCFRAEEKVFGSKGGKLVAFNPPVWAPVCGKSMPYEMTAFFLLKSDKPGVPIPIKLQEQHRHMFDLNKPLDESAGKMIHEWSLGGVTIAPTPKKNGGMSESQVTNWCLKMDEAANVEDLGRNFTHAMLACKELRDGVAQKQITAAKDKRKAELSK